MSCNGAQRLLQILAHHGIDILSGIPGGNILPLYDAIHRAGFRHVLARHEQGAAFIAQGIARSSGRLGVCLATSGPGATNLLTGIADAHRDSIPLLAVTGQVPRASIGTQAFQEIDIASMAASCTKAVFRVGSAAELDRTVPCAISAALSGRPGPVLVDIPKDVFLEECPGGPLPAIRTRALRDPSRRELDEASRELAKSRRPLLYVGGGIASAGAQDALRRFARGRRIPAVSTLLGLGAFRHDDPFLPGDAGDARNPAANRALEECDLLIVAGARFDDRATGRMDGFAPGARVVHLDADPSEFGRRRSAHATVHGDARRVLELWHGTDSFQTPREWIEALQAMRSVFPMPPQPAHDLFRSIASECPSHAIVTTDVGSTRCGRRRAGPWTVADIS